MIRNIILDAKAIDETEFSVENEKCKACMGLEIRQMIDDIIDSGVKYGVATPNLIQLKSYISS